MRHFVLMQLLSRDCVVVFVHRDSLKLVIGVVESRILLFERSSACVVLIQSSHTLPVLFRRCDINCSSVLFSLIRSVRSAHPRCGRFHVFHGVCLQDRFVASSGCPLCRTNITELKKFRLPSPFMSALAAKHRPRLSLPS